MPKAGDFYIIDSKTCSEWKLDKYSYRKGEGTTRVREIRNFLKIDNVKQILSIMYSGDGEKTPTGFRRRTYRLTKDSRYILIHYLNLDEKADVEKNAEKPKKKEKKEKKEKAEKKDGKKDKEEEKEKKKEEKEDAAE